MLALWVSVLTWACVLLALSDDVAGEGGVLMTKGLEKGMKVLGLIMRWLDSPGYSPYCIWSAFVLAMMWRWLLLAIISVESPWRGSK